MSNEVPPGIIVSGTLQRQAWIDRVLPPVEMVRPGLWSIPTPFPNSPLRYVLTYAIAYDGGVALVDTGWPCSEAWDGLSAGLQAAGWDLTDIKAVLITHGHGDHMGLARRLREHTGAWVAMHEADTDNRHHFRDRETFKRASDEALRKRGGLDADFAAAASMAAQPLPDNFGEFAAGAGPVPGRRRAPARPRQPAGRAAHARSHPRARVLLRQRPQRGADRRPHPAADHAEHQPGAGRDGRHARAVPGVAVGHVGAGGRGGAAGPRVPVHRAGCAH